VHLTEAVKAGYVKALALKRFVSKTPLHPRDKGLG